MDNLTDQEVIALFFTLGACTKGEELKNINEEIKGASRWYVLGECYVHPTVNNFNSYVLFKKIYDEVVNRNLFIADYMEANNE